MSAKPEIITLCCGAGIAEPGIAQYFHNVLAVDNWIVAILTHIHNYPDVPTLLGSISSRRILDCARRRLAGRTIRGIISSAPCQAFSNAGNLDPFDCRAMPYIDALKWVEAFRPDFFVAENVENIKNSPYFGLAIVMLKRLGYSCRVWICDAKHYGVPQSRRRLFLVGVRNGLPIPKPPPPTHGPKGSGLLPYNTLGDAIGHLTEEQALRLGCDKLSDERTEYFQHVPPGGNYKNLPPHLRERAVRSLRGRPHKSLCGRLDYNVVHGTIRTGPQILTKTFPIHPGYKLDATSSEFRLIEPSSDVDIEKYLFWLRRPSDRRPSPTVVTSPDKSMSLLIHPLITRCLSVVEYLLLQGCSLDFRPFGNVDDRYKLIGNGIPPALIGAVCGAIACGLFGKGSGM